MFADVTSPSGSRYYNCGYMFHLLRVPFLICFALCTIGISGQCQPGKTPQEAGVKFPDLISQSFKAEMAGLTTTEYAAMRFQEHHSEESGRGSVYTEGPLDQYYFFLTEDNRLRTAGGRSQCQNTTNAPIAPGLTHLTRKALEPDTATFIESTELAGIPVNHWRTCYPFSMEDRGDLVASLDTFLTYDDKWEMYTGAKDVLLRISVDIFENDVQAENFILDFIKFENRRYDANKFEADLEPPLGVVCLGMKQDRQQPEVPKAASLWRETIYKHGEHRYISEMDGIVLDTQNQVLQTQTSVATKVQDFNGGATYLIMRIKEHYTTCAVMPVNRLNTRFVQDDISPGFTFNDHYVTMSSVKDDLYLSGDFTFNGEYEARGIPCHVFTHTTLNFGGKGQRASILLYFSKPGLTVADRGGLSQNKLVKIEIRVEGTSPIIQNINNLAEYHSDDAPDKPYDISPCFDEMRRIEFQLVLEPQDQRVQAALTANERRALEQDVRKLIAKMCGLNLVRVHVGTAVEKQGLISVNGKLFARPDSGMHFDHYVGKSFGSDSEATRRVLSLTHDIANIDYCAELAASDPLATDADYCKSNKMCILYGARGSGPEIALVNDQPCSHLTKIKGYDQLTHMSTAWHILEEMVYKSAVECKTQSRVFKFSSIRRINDPNAKLHKISPLNSFKKSAHEDMAAAGGQKLTKKMRLNECADRCLNNLLFPCEGFRYCEDSSSCELHSFALPAEGEPEPDSGRAPRFRTEKNCVVYVRSYLHNFERHPGTVASMTSTSSDTEVADVVGSENCAKICMDRDDFQCESFDFCSADGLEGTCVMHKHHWRDFTQDNAGKPQQNCSHFSSNYFWDYTRWDGVTALPVRTSVKNAGGAETCAYECSASPDCDTFHYCEDGDQCQYLDTSAGKPSPGDTSTRYRCYTFVQKELQDVMDRHDTLAEKLAGAPTSREGFSNGAMAGLAVGMLVLGVALAFFILFGWTLFGRHRARARDSMNENLNLKMRAQSTEDVF